MNLYRIIMLYHTGKRNAAVEEIIAALPFMDSDMRKLAERTMGKLNALTGDGYLRLTFAPANMCS